MYVKIPAISAGDRMTGTAIMTWFIPLFIIEEMKFQLEVSENKDVPFFPTQGHRSTEFYPRLNLLQGYFQSLYSIMLEP